MNARSWRGLWATLVSLSLILLPFAHAQQQVLDVIAPQVTHEPPEKEVASGEPLVISATVTDNVAVADVTLFYRIVGEPAYRRAPMTRIGQTDMFMVTLAAEQVSEPGLEYYMQAVDTADNTLLFGFAQSPLLISVARPPAPVAAAPLPPAVPIEAATPASRNTWMWVLLGVGAAVLIASAAGGGGGGGGDDDSIVINGPLPQ